MLGVTKLNLTCPWFLRASSKPQQICFDITRIFINTSVLRKTNGSNFEAKLFPSVPDIVNGHVVYWKAMGLGSVHLYDCFSPSTVFDLKRVRVKILSWWKRPRKEEKNHMYAPPHTQTPFSRTFFPAFPFIVFWPIKLSLVAISLENCEGGSLPRPLDPPPHPLVPQGACSLTSQNKDQNNQGSQETQLNYRCCFRFSFLMPHWFPPWNATLLIHTVDSASGQDEAYPVFLLATLVGTMVARDILR